MAAPPPIPRAPGLAHPSLTLSTLTRTLRLLPSFLLSAALSPTLTGPLILLLTTTPPPSSTRLGSRLHAARERLLRLLPPGRVDRVVRALKVLFAVGVVRVWSAWADGWAMRGWRWGGGRGERKGVQKAGVGVWDFEGGSEVVVVTGGCGGIGREVVRGLVAGGKAGAGLRVVVVDVVELPGEFEGHPNIAYQNCDLSDSESIHRAADIIRADYGNPTVLINNAGIASQRTILESSDEADEKLIRVNLLSHFTLIRRFLPAMIEQKKGHIVSVASVASHFSGADLVVYSASKAGVLALHEGLNVELRQRYGPAARNILTSIVLPRWTATGMTQEFEQSLRSSGTSIQKASDVADRIVRHVLRGEPAHMFMPESMSVFSTFRGWPIWMQELVRDREADSRKPVAKAKGKERISDVGFGVGEDREYFDGGRSYQVVEG